MSSAVPAPVGASKSSDPSLPKARGYHYRTFIEQIHQTLKPRWYMEVGTATGQTLKLSKCSTIAVDPIIRIKPDALSGRPQTHLYEMTSDAFFEAREAAKLTDLIDLAFLDGMHLFEFLLRDFMHTERMCAPESTILLHDLLPPNGPAADREWDREATGMWTGDVWKLAVILRKYRPDLDFQIADCRPSGLGIVTQLDPSSTVLSDNYDAIVAEFSDMTLADVDPSRFAEAIAPKSASDPSFDRFAGARRDPSPA